MDPLVCWLRGCLMLTAVVMVMGTAERQNLGVPEWLERLTREEKIRRKRFLPGRSEPGKAATFGKCCLNGGLCLLGSFCQCPIGFTGRYCQWPIEGKSCGPVGHMNWAKLGCNLCRCFSGKLTCITNAYHTGCKVARPKEPIRLEDYEDDLYIWPRDDYDNNDDDAALDDYYYTTDDYEVGELVELTGGARGMRGAEWGVWALLLGAWSATALLASRL